MQQKHIRRPRDRVLRWLRLDWIVWFPRLRCAHVFGPEIAVRIAFDDGLEVLTRTRGAVSIVAGSAPRILRP